MHDCKQSKLFKKWTQGMHMQNSTCWQCLLTQNRKLWRVHKEDKSLSKLTIFGASQTVDGFQINDIHVSIITTFAQADNASFIHRHSFYVPSQFDFSEKKMCRNDISFLQTFQVVDVQF